MVAAATDTTARIADLSDKAFHAFCDDMEGMFGVDMRCERRDVGIQTTTGLRDHFKKLNAVHLVRGQGALDGTFHLVFDQGGLFILSGVVVMLPESRILDEVKRGSDKEAQALEDAAREVGNLLVGSWDRSFREECEGHEHFLKTSTFIGKPWDDLGKIELPADADVLAGLYEMTLEPYPSFTCAAIFPKAVLEGLERGGTPSTPEAASDQGATPEEPPKESVVGETSSPEAESVEPPPTPAAAQESIPEPVSVETPVSKESEATGTATEADALPSELAATQVGRTGEPPAPAGFSFLDPAYVESGPPLRDGALTELLRTPAARIMEKEVVWAGPEDTVQDIIAKMQQHNSGYVLIGQNGSLEGLVSNSNILGAVSLYLRPMFAKWRRPQDDATLGVKVKWIMSRPVRTIRPDATLGSIIESMRRYGGRCLPVVDGNGTVQGIVTAFDVMLRVLEAEQSFSWKGRPPQAPPLLI